VSSRDHGKATVLGLAVEHGENDLRQRRYHLPITAMILTLRNDRRAMHVQTGESPTPPGNGVGVIQPIWTTGDRLDGIEHHGNVHEIKKGIVALDDVGDIEIILRTFLPGRYRCGIVGLRHLFKTVQRDVARLHDGCRHRLLEDEVSLQIEEVSLSVVHVNSSVFTIS
jgi:hypothetical protein